MAQGLRTCVAPAGNSRLFPRAMSGSPQLPVALAPAGNSMPLASESSYIHFHPHMHKHIIKK